MVRNALYLLGFWLMSAVALADWAPDGIRIGYGQYMDVSFERDADIRQQKLGVIWESDQALWSTESLQLTPYIELGVGYWKSHLNPPENPNRIGAKTVKQVSLSPVFRLNAAHRSGFFHPFLDAGVGLSYQDKRDLEQGHLSGINMAGHWQFEIRLFAGFAFGEAQSFELSYGWMHYSNANLGDINEGLDFQTIQLGYRF